MDDIVVLNEGVTKLLKGLNPSKTLGPDELHRRVLKELATELYPVFAHLFQKSLDTGEIPNEWSLASICPLHKKGDRALAYNHRPVSLTCVPCKLLEHIVCSNIMAHLDEYKLLSDRQHTFRKGHSCETQLITVINDWAKILDNGGQVDTFILDFEKAFDTPLHELLKSKLFRCGIGGKTLKWIDSFLCYRQRRGVVNGVKSDWAPVLSAVPQGTVLGSLLLSLYINDISTDIEISGVRLNDGPDIKLFILVGLGRSLFVCCLAHRGSTVGFLLLQCSSGVVRHPRDLQVSVATHFCRVLIFASS